MSQAEDLLNSLTEDEVAVTSVEPETEPHIVINKDRTVTVPEELKHIAVEGDHNIETVTFDCPRYWDGHDLSEMNMRIVFQRPDGHKEPHPVENPSVDETDTNMIHFDWTLSKNVTLVRGNISFTVCAKIADAEGIVDREWHTRLNQDLVVDEGMDCSGDAIVEQNPDIIESILVRLDIAEQGGVSDEQIAAAVEAYMTEHPVEVPDSGQNPTDKLVLKSPDGTAWNITVSNAGVITATKVTSGGDSGGSEDAPTTLETYTIFVPENVSDEWKVTSIGALDMTTAEFLELFYDGFVSAPPSGMTVTKTSIGKDESEQYDMWEYDFCPANYSRTILLSSGMHTYELSASFGLANFIGHLYTDSDNDAFDYIRNNVRIKVIPIVNPWGFNQSPKTYGNINGVNPNRNFDLNGEWAAYNGDTTEWNQKGVAPFSESEAHNLARWAEDNWNAEFWIDCHTGEQYSDKDLWLYYSSDSVILDRINNSISKIEAWFKETYGVDCVTTRTIDNPDSIRMHWAEKIAGIPGMTLEQAPKRETFGTSAMNEAADISNYSTNISTFVQEFLMEKYRGNSVIAITGVSASSITISGDTLSVTAEAVMTPGNSTQNKFRWESSDESVVAVYGCTNKAIIVRKGEGTATITLTNHEKSSVSASFTATVEAEETFMEIGAGIRAIDVTTGYMEESTNRIVTDLIPVEDGNLAFTCPNGFYIKAWQYDADGIATGDVIGGLTSSNISGTVTDGYIRVLYKRSDNSDITETAMQDVAGTINGAKYKLVATTVENVTTFNLGAGIRAVDIANNVLTESTKRITTDPMFVTLCGVANNNTISVPSGYAAKFFYCDENGTLNGTYSANFVETTTIGGDWGSTGRKYARICIKKTDDSDITEAEMLAIKLTHSGGYTYQLVQTEEQ